MTTNITNITTDIVIPGFTISGIRATAIINATAAYNAAQLKSNPKSVYLSATQYFQLQIENQQIGQATQEVMRQLKDPATSPFVDAVLSAPSSKRGDLLAITHTPAAT